MTSRREHDRPRRVDRLAELHAALLATPPSERTSVAVRLCPDDPTLSAEALQLVALDPATDQLTGLVGSALGVRGTALQALIGSRIERFTLRRVLGTGGMGVVFEGVDASTGEIVALKLLRGGLFAQGAARRFSREVGILTQLEHPGIVRVCASGSLEILDRAQPWVAMELVRDARSLTHHARVARLDLRQRLALIVETCDALAYAHQRGIVHRDVKPSNLLVGSDGRVRLIDFGVAALGSGDAASTTITSTGALVGTLDYMSPEQCSGQMDPVDRRTDVYSLGVVLHELATGRRPFELQGQSVTAAIRLICAGRPPGAERLRTELGTDLDRVVSRALAPRAELRYGSAQELGDDLRRILAGERPSAARIGITRRVRTWATEHALRAVVFASGAMALVVAAVAVLDRSGQDVRGAKTDGVTRRPPALEPAAARTTLVSRTANGGLADGPCDRPRVSADGRFVAFISQATNLDPLDRDPDWDVYLLDRASGRLRLVSHELPGAPEGGDCSWVSMSDDGRIVTFDVVIEPASRERQNPLQQVYVWEADLERARLVSTTPAGAAGNGASRFPAIAGDGSRVAFESEATDLAPGDRNLYSDVYVWERSTGSVRLVSQSFDGSVEDGTAQNASLSGDGRLVAFASRATNVVSEDRNLFDDVFVRDLRDDSIRLASVSSRGTPANAPSGLPVLSRDGRRVAFHSKATSLVDGEVGATRHAFVRDLSTRLTELVSVDLSGAGTIGEALPQALDLRGTVVAFEGRWIPGGTLQSSGATRVFLFDRDRRVLTQISVSASGADPDSGCSAPDLAADGRVAVFASDATNLVEGDGNGMRDVFLVEIP